MSPKPHESFQGTSLMTLSCATIPRCPQDWDDSHGWSQGPKEVVQDMLLPHEAITTFLETGETERMIGQTVPNLNAFGCGIFLFSKT